MIKPCSPRNYSAMKTNSNQVLEQDNVAVPPKCLSVASDFKLTPEVERKLVEEVMDEISGWARGRVEEVLAEPGSYGSDLVELSEEICGCIGDHLHYEVRENVEDILKSGWPRK
jgi:hypothetical protein